MVGDQGRQSGREGDTVYLFVYLPIQQQGASSASFAFFFVFGTYKCKVQAHDLVFAFGNANPLKAGIDDRFRALGRGAEWVRFSL